MIPPVGTPIGIKDLLAGLCARGAEEAFCQVIGKQMGRRFVLLANSGTAAYFLILEALKRLSPKREVILPAYTAPSLILPILKAGLHPRLCDISLETFNMDLEVLQEVITEDTLAITMVHMFGLPNWFASHPREGPFLVEDIASAQGSTLHGRPVGSFGDVSFVSFNRGKNFATVSGGGIGTDREDIYRLLKGETEQYLRRPPLRTKVEIIIKAFALSLAVRPWFYTPFRRLISRFRYQGLHTSFDLYAYTRFQAGMGLSALRKADLIFNKRFENGLFLYRSLSGTRGLIVPRIPDGSLPAFNQFPFLVEEVSKRERIVAALIEGGIEATTLYPQPIHRVYDLGYQRDKDSFPKASYLSERLILIPTHPYMTRKYLEKGVEIVLRFCGI